MSRADFIYSPIDLDRPSFRLVRLLGGSNSNIECHVFDAWLDQVKDGGVPYEALSYVWGGTEETAKIRINGSTMVVTENLYIALLHLQLPDTDRILWIDAICIYPIRSRFSCRRFWRHRPPETAVFVATFPSESENIFSVNVTCDLQDLSQRNPYG
jgi:hypothetical protein